MSPVNTALKGLLEALPEGEAPVLRLHEEVSPPRTLAPAGGLILDDPRALAIWGRLLDRFLDRAAARRLHYEFCRAGHPWKPRLALVLPEGFSPDRPAHLRDLAAALEVLAAVVDHYRIQVVSDAPGAARLFRDPVPYSREAISSTAGALVLLSRSLNDEIGAIRPSRYITADTCAYRTDGARIAFAAAGVDLASRPVEDHEILRNARGCLSVLIDEDDEVPAFLDAMRRLRAEGLSLRVTLSSRADEDFSRRIRAVFHHDPRVVVSEPEPGVSLEAPGYQISNDPITLLTQRESALPRYLHHRGKFWAAEGRPRRRSDVYLLRGEESNAHGLLNAWLGRREPNPAPAATRAPDTAAEPLVSIVVPVFDRTTEVVRLARSIYEQDYRWIEVIFVCSGSPPETMEAVRISENYLMKRRYGVRVIELTDGGRSAALPRDFGVRAASGDLVCWLDSEDWLDHGFFTFFRSGSWRDDTLYYPARALHHLGRAIESGGSTDRESIPPGTLETTDLVATLRREDFLGISGVVFARSLFDRAGGVDHRLLDGEAFHLWWRMARAGARAQEHRGRVNLSIHPEGSGPSLGADGRTKQAFEPAWGRRGIECH